MQSSNSDQCRLGLDHVRTFPASIQRRVPSVDLAVYLPNLPQFLTLLGGHPEAADAVLKVLRMASLDRSSQGQSIASQTMFASV